MTHELREAILLKPSALPALGPSPARSFFGGLPQMPAGRAWLCKDVNGRARPLTFVAQIHLDDLPKLRQSPLPQRGTLCFFLGLGHEYLDEDDVGVVFFEEPLDRCVEHRHPMQFIDEAVAPWPWVPTSELTHHPYFKFPIEFAAIESDPENSIVTFGVTAPGQAWTPEGDDSWVFSWSVIEHAVRALLHQVRGSEASDSIVGAAEGWLQQVAERPSLDAPEPPIQRAFGTAWRDWRAAFAGSDYKAKRRAETLDMTLVEAIRLAACRCMAGQVPDRVPQHLRQRLEDGWSRRTVGEGNHRRVGWELNQMLGYGEPVQSTPLDRIEDVLLLQIKDDQYAAWWPPAAQTDGVIQCWISAADLAARNFERVTVNFDCT